MSNLPKNTGPKTSEPHGVERLVDAIERRRRAQERGALLLDGVDAELVEALLNRLATKFLVMLCRALLSSHVAWDVIAKDADIRAEMSTEPYIG